MNLSIRSEQVDSTYHIHLAGEIDTYTAPQLRESLLPLAEKENLTINIHFDEVEYIDSTGLGVFVGILKATDANGGQLTLQGMSSRVKRLFTITGLDEVITIKEKEGQS
ncbi:anti-sigma F factor antagonist [Bacillus sp. JCM 19046]|uniref:Anti-sigma factor antagonist n=1 Tax=Shouchella xiaoxiensis TaxID=766895 RepID=A0ABS2SSW8_9BACI|nr:anti-sigma factor antagonist [Shouchella xiaoxiensis]MBM7838628.1 anti-sigma B factor antagonist [Shouchella xiaoxiensis]GAF11777.1 anti-sigma F factor antagonist [Bacillus sp. JCM 19045]GAF16072.1 anti-sigma F factor antagonist [Bacillus sp. JCM 19046]